jgi:hypothetical protein
MKMVLPEINFIGALRPTMSVTYTATLPVRQETALYPSSPAPRRTAPAWHP